MDDNKSDIFLESFTSVAESYYTYNSPNPSQAPSPTFSRKADLSIISGVPSLNSNSRFSLTAQSELWNNHEEDKSQESKLITWKSILFGVLLITGIIFITSVIIIVPRSTKNQDEQDGFSRSPTCSGIGTTVGDGFCDDELNSRTCNFDGGDCCLNSSQSRVRCSECQCVFQETTLSTIQMVDTTTTTQKIEVKNYGEICSQDDCFLTGAIQFGAKSRQFWAYIPIVLGDGNHSIAKCKTPLAYYPRTDVPLEFEDQASPLLYNGMTYSHAHGEIYLCGGLGRTFDAHEGWEILSNR